MERKNLVFYFGGGRHASFTQKPVVKISSNLLTIVGLLETHSFGNPGAVHPEHGDLTQAMDKHEKAPKGFFANSW